MDVQFSLSGLKVNIAKRLELSDFLLREFYEHAPISRETLKVAMALAIQIRTHLLDLKIGHIIYTSAQSAFMGPWASELKTLNQTSRGQHLAGCAYDLNKTDIADKDADDMSASGNPDNRLVLFGIYATVGINLEKLRMQRSLKQAEHQFFNSYIDLW